MVPIDYRIVELFGGRYTTQQIFQCQISSTILGLPSEGPLKGTQASASILEFN